MRKAGLILTAALFVSAGMAGAATIEVRMLNKGEAGAMVFEPAFVAAEVGDTIRFVSVDPGHNAASIEGMLPEGVAPFESEMSKDFELTVGAEGLYGIKCTPHYAMGMVALVQVGEAVNLEAAKAVVQKGKARARFEALFAEVK